MEPPTYSLHPPSLDSEHELPNYADLFAPVDVFTSLSNRQPTAHVYGVKNRRDGPEWLQLHVTSRAKHTGQLPVIRQGDPIVGSVQLNLEQDLYVKAVNIVVSSFD